MKSRTVDFLCERIEWDLDDGDTPKGLGLPAKAVVRVQEDEVKGFVVKEKGRNGKRFFLIDRFAKPSRTAGERKPSDEILADELSDRFGFCVSGIGKVSVQNMECLEDA